MNHKQKLGYMLLGAGIMAFGITIGQFITPNIEAQSNGVFDKIICREIEVVDKDGKKAIVLQSNEHDPRGNRNQVIVYNPQNKRANVVGIELSSSESFNEVRITDKLDNGSGIWLYSAELEMGNQVVAFQPGTGSVGGALTSRETYSGLYIKDEISLESSDKQNLISVEDVKEVPKRAAFEIYSNDDGNYSSRWVRGRGRRTNW